MTPTEGPSPAGVPVPPPEAGLVFGTRLDLAARFVSVLADTGVTHGLIGPREVPRLWERHVLNCAVIADSIDTGCDVIDVGSGAGLPGLAIAIARPDLRVHLVEPMLRRTTWLSQTVATLGLEDSVTVHRGRAEEFAGVLRAPVVTARAVAALDVLTQWCRPLLTDDGVLLAMKGRTAAAELDSHRGALDALGLRTAEIVTHGAALLADPVITVDLRFRPGKPVVPVRPRRRSRRDRAR